MRILYMCTQWQASIGEAAQQQLAPLLLQSNADQISQSILNLQFSCILPGPQNIQRKTTQKYLKPSNFFITMQEGTGHSTATAHFCPESQLCHDDRKKGSNSQRWRSCFKMGNSFLFEKCVLFLNIQVANNYQHLAEMLEHRFNLLKTVQRD